MNHSADRRSSRSARRSPATPGRGCRARPAAPRPRRSRHAGRRGSGPRPRRGRARLSRSSSSTKSFSVPCPFANDHLRMPASLPERRGPTRSVEAAARCPDAPQTSRMILLSVKRGRRSRRGGSPCDIRCSTALNEIVPARVEPGDPFVPPKPRVLPPGELAGPGDRLVPAPRPRSARRRGNAGSAQYPSARDAVSPSRSPCSTSRSTSATKPAAHIASTRSRDPGVQARPVEVEPDLAYVGQEIAPLRQRCRERALRSGRSPPAPGPPGGRCPAGCDAAAAGSCSASRACSASGPSSASSASSLARSPGSVPGNWKSSSTARTYRAEPPTRIGTTPLARQSAIAVARQRLELRDRGGLGDVEDVDQVVRHAGELVRRRLCRADVHPAIEQHRVGVDDLGRPARRAASASRERQRRATTSPPRSVRPLPRSLPPVSRLTLGSHPPAWLSLGSHPPARLLAPPASPTHLGSHPPARRLRARTVHSAHRRRGGT